MTSVIVWHIGDVIGLGLLFLFCLIYTLVWVAEWIYKWWDK